MQTVEVHRVYKYRLYPTSTQEASLLNQFELARRIYNKALWWREGHWKRNQQGVTKKEQVHALVDLKQDAPEYAAFAPSTLEDVIKRVDLAFQNFFRRCKRGEKPGYPRSKGSGWYKSLSINRSREFKMKHDGGRYGYLSFKGFSDLRLRMHRPLPPGAHASRVQIKREASGRWYACFGVTFNCAEVPREDNKAIGVDVGLNSYIATSDGEHVPGRKSLKRSEKKLSKAQRSLSRKKRGSNRRKKARTHVAKIHEKISNQRRDFQHNLSRKLVDEYATIGVEKLNVRGMVKNHCLAKSISDAAWSSFISMLNYKAESAGTQLIKVDPRYTSQICSACGQLPDEKKTLADRVHKCECGLVLDRDVNAARNILERAVQALRGETVRLPPGSASL